MSANQQQAEAWNGVEGMHFVTHADRYDRQFAPFCEALFERVRLEPHHSVLDVGCGSGITTLTAAHVVRAAVGIDISTPLLEVAAKRAHTASLDNVEFVVADAQTSSFEEAAFDIAISHFGVMFFDDPVAAFDNIRQALVPGGQTAFVCWQELEANDWVMAIGGPVAQHIELPSLGGRAGGPGMFALKDPDETEALLAAAGFVEIDVEPIATDILVGGGGSLEESTAFLLDMGIARGLLGRLDPEARAAAVEAVRTSLAARYEPGVGVRLGASAWFVSGRT